MEKDKQDVFGGFLLFICLLGGVLCAILSIGSYLRIAFLNPLAIERERVMMYNDILQEMKKEEWTQTLMAEFPQLAHVVKKDLSLIEDNNLSSQEIGDTAFWHKVAEYCGIRFDEVSKPNRQEITKEGVEMILFLGWLESDEYASISHEKQTVSVKAILDHGVDYLVQEVKTGRILENDMVRLTGALWGISILLLAGNYIENKYL